MNHKCGEPFSSRPGRIRQTIALALMFGLASGILVAPENATAQGLEEAAPGPVLRPFTDSEEFWPAQIAVPPHLDPVLLAVATRCNDDGLSTFASPAEPADPPCEVLAGDEGSEDGPGGSGGGGGGGGSPDPMTLVVLHSEEYSYGNWRGVGLWYRVTNDADPANRYYVTVTKWWGDGFSPGGTDWDYYQRYSQIYHLARGWAGDGNTYLHDFQPLNADPGTGQWGLSIGWPPAATYTWTQERPAYHRYGLWDLGTSGWDDQEYGNRATFDEGSGDPYYMGRLEYGAAGVVPTGHVGYMYVLMNHVTHEYWFGNEFNDNTGWKSWPINWT